MSRSIGRVVSLCLTFAAVAFQPTLSARTSAQESHVTPPIVVKAVSATGGKKTDRVTFDCTILDDGTVSIIGILKSSDARLNDAATEAMKQWLFKPATRDGKPVPFRIAVEISFKP